MVMISVSGPHRARSVLPGLSLLGCFDVAWFLIAVRQDMHSTDSDGRWARLHVRSPEFGSSI